MEPGVVGCPHWWLLVRAVLDGRGAWRVLRCWFCGAESVEPASGDR
jgi:hypothetical protein